MLVFFDSFTIAHYNLVQDLFWAALIFIRYSFKSNLIFTLELFFCNFRMVEKNPHWISDFFQFWSEGIQINYLGVVNIVSIYKAVQLIHWK